MSQNTNIYNKLDYLDETKQLILQAIKDKGINPGDVAEVFRQYPSFIRAIETLDTSDATALPQDIAISKTAYANGNKITGTTPKVTKIDATALPSINNNGLKFAYNQPYRALLEPEANVGLSVSNINMANFLELRADNLKKDYTLFGVTGTYEGGSTEDLNEVLTQQEQKIQELENIIKNKTNPPSSTGDVKLFKTVEEMQADPEASEGDLAVVYREELQPVTENSEFNSCIFPNTVVLDEAFSGNIYGSFRSTGSYYFDGMMDMSSTAFSFDGWGESGNINVQYTSSDGITYTRTDSGEELQKFGTTIKWESWGQPFNDVIGNFMKIGGNYFEGLYEYKTIDDENYCNGFTNFNILEETFEQAKVSIQSLYTAYNLVNNYDNNTIMNALTEIVDVNNINFYTYNSSNSSYYYAYLFTTAKYDGVNKYFISRRNGASTNVYTMYRYSVNLINNTVTRTQLPLTSISNIISYWNSEIDTSHIWLNYNFEMGKPTNQIQFSSRLTETTVSNSAWTIHTNKPTKTLYNITTTQLDVTSDYVFEKTFYGKNGVEIGSLGVNMLNSFDDTSAQVFSYLQIQYENMPTIKITDSTWNLLSNKMITIPRKLNGELLIDTSEVTKFTDFNNYVRNIKYIPTLDMSNAQNCYGMFWCCSNVLKISDMSFNNVTNISNMFYGCSNLIDAPNMNTTNVISSYSLFYGCQNLINVPNYNLSNTKTTYEMFSECYNLVSVPNFNICNSTYTSRMFIACKNLISAPVLDTRNVIQCNLMFYNCSNLVNVPVYNMRKVNTIYSMFWNCLNLSNESLNNIMATCISMTNSSLTNKTLKNIGLSQNQVNICKNLSNFNNFISAGWTTGY